MERMRFVLANTQARQAAIDAVRMAPTGYVAEIREAKRTLDQNAALWAALEDIAEQVVWHGVRLSAEDWKDVLTASWRRQRVVPAIDGGGFVALGARTSRMTKQEMSDVLDLAHAFGNERGVRWSGPDAEQG